MAVEFENHRVRVTRVKVAAGGPRTTASSVKRLDRLVVWLRGSSAHRQQVHQHPVTLLRTLGDPITMHRSAGDFVWRDASEHTVIAADDDDHEVLIIEFKDAPTDGVSREMWDHFQQLARDDHNMRQAEIERLRKALNADV